MLRCDVWSICSVPERKFDTGSPPNFKNTSIKSVKNVRDLLLVIVGYFVVIDGLMVVSLSPYPAPHPLSYSCINLHTMWKITNDNVLKNDSQYPLAIQINNSLLLKRREQNRQAATEWERGKRASIASYIDIYGLEAVRKCTWGWLPVRVCVCLENRGCFEYLMHVEGCSGLYRQCAYTKTQ